MKRYTGPVVRTPCGIPLTGTQNQKNVVWVRPRTRKRRMVERIEPLPAVSQTQKIKTLEAELVTAHAALADERRKRQQLESDWKALLASLDTEVPQSVGPVLRKSWDDLLAATDNQRVKSLLMLLNQADTEIQRVHDENTQLRKRLQNLDPVGTPITGQRPNQPA